ncbi:MAG: T9SS type A sorting domain-containing protein [Candidatus Cloacimonadales bacterium]|nr:T9SS type A sorting domain-containing protein [Candidatus Cloacimonadales bacterium]
MKILIVFVVCLSFLPLPGKVTMNEYGHISNIEKQLDEKFLVEDNEYFIRIDNLKLAGNSLFELPNGYLTLVTIEENIPTWLRIYDKNGYERFLQKFPKVINLSLSENKSFAAFSDGKELVVLNLENFNIDRFPNSVVFAVDNFGRPAFITDNSLILINRNFSLESIPQKILFFRNEPLIFTSEHIYKIADNLKSLYTFGGKYFEAEVIDEKLYFVERTKLETGFRFQLFSSFDLMNFSGETTCDYQQEKNRTHEEIQCPLLYGIGDYAFPVGNSYGEHQNYGGDSYAHPGVDFLGEDYQEVYAVHDGYVKAVLTTGGSAYWRIAIADQNLPEETEGYLYAHLNQNSITVNAGGEVQAGDQLGTLYDWPVYGFTHTHFARVKDEGTFWNGTWWTVDNPLVDVTNIQDSIPPVFENAINDDKFAFRTAAGNYLDPLNLQGEFDIIAKCHDLCNCDWRIDVWDLRFSLHPASNPDSTLYELFSFKFDMLLDEYFGNYWTDLAVNTIYSQDDICQSMGNYDVRDYYHIITNSDGDSLITENDEPQLFDSTQFDDGFYYFKVTARDACLNTTIDSMVVSFNNGVSTENELPENEVFLTNYPNPFNPSTTISFDLDTENTEIEIYNLKGQKVKVLECSNSFAAYARDSRSTHSIIWDGTDQTGKPVTSGIYFYKLKTNHFEKTKKMILMK